MLADRGTTGNPTATSHTVFAYTGLGDLDYETQTLAGGTPRTTDYGYDQAGNRTSVIYPSGETLAYVPTALNQVDTVSLNTSPLLDYSYNGQRLDKRRTTTNDTGHATVYETGWGYDDHRRINAVDNILEVDAAPQTVAAYAFTHDNNGNPLTQTTTGASPFAGDHRTFTVDALNRLTDTAYAQTGTSELSTLDLVGNRESHTDRAGQNIAYTLANAANEYATINAQAVSYDAAGNLTTDEDDRTYQYDERNRLIEVRDNGANLLASYSYDALGRRVVATFGTVTTRYYYDSQNVIEERDGSDVRVRYHVHGSQYIDERVTTFEDAGGAFTYYLLKENFSVAGTGNADGSTIERLDYSATGSFAGSGGGIDVDYNDDGYVDADDLAEFEACASGPAIPQNDPNCAGMKLDADDDVDQSDFGLFQVCYSGTELALPECTGAGGGLPASGTFVLHGRPVDVLPDGHTLLFVRSRFYDMTNGRWLQRDPIPYNDGTNLYESFRGNALRFTDPQGEGVITFLFGLGYQSSDAEFLGHVGSEIKRRSYGPLQERSYERFLLMYQAQEAGDALFSSDVDIMAGGVLLALGDILPSGKFAEAGTGISAGRFEQAGSTLGGGTRVVRGGVATGETALWALFSTQGGQATQGLLGRSGAVQAAEVRFFQATGGQMRLGLLSEGGFLTAAGANAGLLSGPARQEAIILVFQQGLESGITQYGLATAGAARLGAAELFLSGAGTQPTRLAANIAAGQGQEVAAQAWAAAQGETLLRTQFQQGAVVRGIDFASFLRSPEGGVQLFLNEVSSTHGLRAPGSFTALGMGRGGQPVFQQNLLKVREAILAQMPPGPLQEALLSQSGTVRLLGPSGFGVTPQGLTRIQATTNRPAVVLIVPPTAP